MSLSSAVRAAVLVIAAAAAGAAAQEGEPLRWSWSPGQVNRYQLNQEMVQSIAGLGEDKTVQWTIQYVVRQEVKSVSGAGIATVEQTYESGSVHARESPGEDVRWDSTKKADAKNAEHRLVAPYAAFVGKTIIFDAGPEGEIPRLEGASAIVDAAIAALRGDPMTAMLLASFKESMGDEAMRKQFEMAMRVVPDRAVKRGDTWTVGVDQQMPLVGTVRNEVTYRLTGVERRGSKRLARIDGKGTLAQVPGAAPPAGGLGAMLGAMAKVTLTSSKVAGDALFDAEAGRIERSGYTVQSDWAIRLELPGGEVPLEGTQRIEQRARMERVDR